MNKLLIKQKTTGIESAVLRVFDDSKIPQMIYYASSRLGTIVITPDGYQVDLPVELEGKKYELKTLPDKKIIASGKIVFTDKKKAEDPSNVIQSGE